MCDGAHFLFFPCCPKLIWLNPPLSAWRYFSVSLSTTKVICNLDEQLANYLTRTDSPYRPTVKLLYICTQHLREITLCNRDRSQLLRTRIIKKMCSMNDLKSSPGSRSPCPLPWGCAASVFCMMSWVLPAAKHGLSATSGTRGDAVVLCGLC